MTEQASTETTVLSRNLGVWGVALIVGTSGGVAAIEYQIPAIEARISETRSELHQVERDLHTCLTSTEVAKARHTETQRRLERLEKLVGIAMERNGYPAKIELNRKKR